MTLISWKDIQAKDYPETPFILDPYIPKQSIVLLWGDTSIGKSPITWAMAQSVAKGVSYFGLPAYPGRVLYIEADTPEVVLAPRLKAAPDAPENVWFYLTPGLSVPNISHDQLSELRDIGREIKPDVVFLNTLRKLHDMDDRESRTPKVVYGFFQHLFPKAALVFVHHIRKTPTDPRIQENDKEAFSGSKHWLDDAQVGLYLSRHSSRDGRENLRLYHIKSQVSETINPLPLRLHPDGTTLTSPLYDQLLYCYEQLNSDEPEDSKGARDKKMAEAFNISPTTAKRRRLSVEHGLFPGSRAFLTPTREDEDE